MKKTKHVETRYYLRVNETEIVDFRNDSELAGMGMTEILRLATFVSSFESSWTLVVNLLKRGLVSDKIDVNSLKVEIVKQTGIKGQLELFLQDLIFRPYGKLLDIKVLKKFLSTLENRDIVSMVVTKYSLPWYQKRAGIQSKIESGEIIDVDGATHIQNLCTERIADIESLLRLSTMETPFTSEDEASYSWYIDRFLHFVMHSQINKSQRTPEQLVLLVADIMNELKKRILPVQEPTMEDNQVKLPGF